MQLFSKSWWRHRIRQARTRYFPERRERQCTICCGVTLIVVLAVLGFTMAVGFSSDNWPSPWLDDLFRFSEDVAIGSPPPVDWEDPHISNPQQTTEIAYSPTGSHATVDNAPRASENQSVQVFSKAKSTIANFETEGAAEEDEMSSAFGSEAVTKVDSDVQPQAKQETSSAVKVTGTRTADEPGSQTTEELQTRSMHVRTSARTTDFETREAETDSQIATGDSDALSSQHSAAPPLLFTNAATAAPATAYVASTTDIFSTATDAFFAHSPPAPNVSSYSAINSSQIQTYSVTPVSLVRSDSRENASATDATVSSSLRQTVTTTSSANVETERSTRVSQDPSAATYVSLAGHRMATAAPNTREMTNAQATTTAKTTTTVKATTTARVTTTTARPTTTTARATTTARPTTTAWRLAPYVPGYIPSIDTIPGIPSWVNGSDDIQEWFRRLPRGKYLGEARAPVVVSSIDECARIGKDVLLDGGSAVDGAIASQICHGFFNPISGGIGGGSFMLVYDETRNQDVVFNAREAAPWSINVRQYESNPKLAVTGGPSIAVPGEVAGYYEAWKRYGKVDWSRLFTRTIYLCEHGHTVSHAFAETLAADTDFLGGNAVLREDYFYKGKVLAEDTVLRRPRLGHTLRRIAADPLSFYGGDLANDILRDLADEGVRWTAADLSRYRVDVGKSLRYDLPRSGRTLLTAPPPSLGLMLGHALGVVDDFNYQEMDDRTNADAERNTAVKMHTVLEAIKYGFGLRINIGDPLFNPDVSQLIDQQKMNELLLEDSYSILTYAFSLRSYYKRLEGRDPTPEPAVDVLDSLDAVQTTAADAAGLHVSLTSSIGRRFGSTRVGRRTGIVFNSALADFTTSVSSMFKKRVNWIAPGARPASTMVPSIVINNDFRVEAVAGATRGSRGVSSLAWAILNRIAFRQDPRGVIWRARTHPDLITNYIEPSRLRESYVKLLTTSFGHYLREAKEADQATVPSLWKMADGKWFGHPDWRRSKGYMSSGGMA